MAADGYITRKDKALSDRALSFLDVRALFYQGLDIGITVEVVHLPEYVRRAPAHPAALGYYRVFLRIR